MNQLAQGPSMVYWMIGILVLANLGSIAACIIAAFKVVWWASAIDQRVDRLEKVQITHSLEFDDFKSDMQQAMRQPARSSV